MAAVISALNAKIRSQPVLSYVFSTHFWGPVSNFGIPIAAVMDTQKDPEIISGKMTGVLAIYSATFMRYSMAVSPRNFLLFGCHFVNCGAQLTQGYRYLEYWNYGGREKALEAKARMEIDTIKREGKAIAAQAETTLINAKDTVEKKMSR